jgi:hypothetical protein
METRVTRRLIEPGQLLNSPTTRRTYVETFDNGPGGWFGFIDNFQGEKPLTVGDGAINSYSPWWVDYNHAPPGAGYMQLVMGLNTQGPFSERLNEITGVNRFVAERLPTNFVNARISLRIKGEIERRGAELVLLVQGKTDNVCSGWALVGQPIEVTQEWSEQTILAKPDSRLWKSLGTRSDRMDMYGELPLETVLSNVNVNLYLVMFSVNVVPMGPFTGDPHKLRAGRDYPIWQSKIPEGYVIVDSVQIEFDE